MRKYEGKKELTRSNEKETASRSTLAGGGGTQYKRVLKRHHLVLEKRSTCERKFPSAQGQELRKNFLARKMTLERRSKKKGGDGKRGRQLFTEGSNCRKKGFSAPGGRNRGRLEGDIFEH